MYSFYVARKAEKNKGGEYWACVLEGEGVHLHETIYVDKQFENAKDALIASYKWGVELMTKLAEFNNIELGSLTFYVPNDTVRRWLEYFVMNDTAIAIKPPLKYLHAVIDLYNAIEFSGSYYRLAVIGSNRATVYANEKYYTECEQKKVAGKAIDFFNEIDE